MNRVLRTAAIAAFAVISTLPAPLRAAEAADPAAEALLAKHKAFVGWSFSSNAPKTMRIHAEQTRDGKTSQTWDVLREGPVYSTSGTKRSASGFTGRVFWVAASDTGFLSQIKGDEVRYLIADDMVDTESLSEMPGHIIRTDTIDGTPAPVVHFTPENAFPIDVAIDSATGAFRTVTIDPGGQFETTLHIRNYTDIGGGRKMMSEFSYGRNTAVSKYVAVKTDVPVSTSELHPPSPFASWTFGPEDTHIPLVVGDKDLRITATVNGVVGHFILDTGASVMAMTDGFARRVNAKRVGESSIMGIGGGSEAHLYKIDTIAFGPHVLHDAKVYAGVAEGYYGDEIDGYIGSGLLSGALVHADLDEGYLTIQDPSKYTPDTSAGVALNVDVSSGSPRVPMMLANKVPVLATLDTGDEMHMMFSDEVINKDHVVLAHDVFGLLGQTTGGKMRFRGVNGTEDDLCGSVDRLSVGPINYLHVPACASPSFSRNDVLVGYDFLKHFDYVFDYPEGVIVMIPRKGEH